MPASLLWSPRARLDLLEIHSAIAADNPAAADRIYATIEAKTALLLDFPRLGPRRREIRPATRILIIRHYLALYETRPDLDDGPVEEIEIVRVLDGRRDLPRLFGTRRR
jgi:toxin ParE1/3/4